jgi:hypothetical protein
MPKFVLDGIGFVVTQERIPLFTERFEVMFCPAELAPWVRLS